MPEGQQSYRKKLIEVALPLEDINRESAREKSIRHGHPSTLHLWWARRPLAACRAVLFAQMVDDPSSLPEDFPTEAAQEVERERLFDIIRDLVKWENTTNEAVLHKARVEIARSAARNHNLSLWTGLKAESITPAEVADALKRFAPPVLDPFAGGGSIPLEAQRLGLEAHASDLNPVAVLINKALIEIPPKFAGCPPVNPESRKRYLQKEWNGAEGLAEDVRYYGKWMRDEAFKRIGHLYPKVRLPKEQGGGEATVIAWIWARTVTCPNPACGARMPLVRSFVLSSKKSKEAWVEPVVDRSTNPPTIIYTVRHGLGAPEGTVNRTGARCIACGSAMPFDRVRAEGKAGRIGSQMMAIICDSGTSRTFSQVNREHEYIAASAQPVWLPDDPVPSPSHDVDRLPMYGMFTWGDAFMPRQAAALSTFCNLIPEALTLITRNGNTISDAEGYAKAVALYLALAVGRSANYWSRLTPWGGDFIVQTFARQALPMVWDSAEANPFSGATGNWLGAIEWIAKCLEVSVSAHTVGTADQHDAATVIGTQSLEMICTDPPYYDNISYADLSDFFYVWLRKGLHDIYPLLFATKLTPKAQELIASQYRFDGNKQQAKEFFEHGLHQVFHNFRKIELPLYPVTLFYAFKQAESEVVEKSQEPRMGTASTGWETMLEGLLQSGFTIDGTWPMRTERDQGVKSGTNVLASSIILVCRPRPADARAATRKEFLNALKRDLPVALKELQRGNIAPVDLAQAAIGPGIAVFSRYSKVIEADGSAMRVRTALQLINQTLDEVLAEQEGEFDADTRFAVAWFEQFGMGQGKFGDADVLARAKNTSVGGLDEAGILEAHGGNVRLLRRDELPDAWNPHQDHRLSVWKVTQHLIHAVMEGGGAHAAAAVLDAVGSDYGAKARDLAYRLYVTSERKKWTQDAFAYNTLVTEWHDIAGGAEGIRERALERERATVRQATLIEE